MLISARKRAVSAMLSLSATAMCPADQTPITIDGLFDDWVGVPLAVQDGTGAAGIDLQRLWIADDDNYLFLRLEVGSDLLLSDGHDLRIYLDTDNDAATGLAVAGIGAELLWEPGHRDGTFYAAGGSTQVHHDDILFRASPGVTANIFEMAFGRNVLPDGATPLFAGSTVRLYLRDGTTGDQMPNAQGGVAYTMDAGSAPEPDVRTLGRINPSDLRMITQNVKDDSLFDPQGAQKFQRIYQSLTPDVLHLQELYNHSATQTKAQIAAWLGGTWYAASAGDCKTVSRYPILGSWVVIGNVATLLDTSAAIGTPMLCISAHLPCCDNNFSRQDEIDTIIAFIREAYLPGGDLELAANVPVIIAGDLNLVGDAQSLITLLTGDITNEAMHGPDAPPDPDGTDMANIVSRHTEQRFAYTWRSDTSSFWPGQLDYLIYSDSNLDLQHDFILYTPEMSPSELAANGLLATDSFASDHLVFCADFNRPCAIDLDGSGIVDLADLLQVIANWGSDGSSGGDATSDGAVDLQDLLAVIAGWGTPCG